MECIDTFEKAEWIDIKELVPDAIVHLILLTDENFVGEKIDGYHANIAYMKLEAAQALKKAADILRVQGYRIVVSDTYRPYRAVKHFLRWAKDQNDTKKKAEYYPHLDKKTIFEKQYIMHDSEHLRGGTVDLTIIEFDKELKPLQKIKRKLKDGSEFLFLDDNTVDMFTSMDLFSSASHPGTELIPEYALKNRKVLQDAMERAGFRINPQEWWHFCYDAVTLNQRYDFPIKDYAVSSRKRQNRQSSY
ncbi:MAG: peptidase M15 [Alphaproteobacteria bacterium]|nr:MAG: peptidase M15 [Alphaproteobacteria bacterium]